jgi:hypothetical protein
VEVQDVLQEEEEVPEECHLNDQPRKIPKRIRIPRSAVLLQTRRRRLRVQRRKSPRRLSRPLPRRRNLIFSLLLEP